MEFYISATSDIGTTRSVNQDSLFVRRLKTPLGAAVMAILCDGMGGRMHGELASSEVVLAFSDWMYRALPAICARKFDTQRLAQEWTALLRAEDQRLRRFGDEQGCSLGTTFVAMLLMQDCFFLANIGDSRAYKLTADGICQLSRDHTLVAQEVARGALTLEQASTAPRRNVLTRCLGSGQNTQPELLFGVIEPETAFVLCSDGLYHCPTPAQLHEHLYCGQKEENFQTMAQRERELIEYCKQSGETDNISVITIYAL